MDTLKFGVLIVAFVVLACMQHDTEAAVGEVCSSDNCTGDGEECNGTACVCSQEYYQNGNNCSSKVILGSNCSSNNQCITQNATCLNNSTCTCHDDFYESGYTCTLKVGHNSSCTASPSACQAAFICKDTGSGVKKCLCENGKYYDGTNCQTKVGHDSSCTASPSACQAAFICTDTGSGVKKCLCENGKYYDGTICQTKVGHNSSCTASPSACQAPFICTDTGSGVKKCLCENGKYYDGTNCQTKVGHDSSCTASPSACQAPFICTDTGSGVKKCLCENGKYYDGTNCQTKVGHNSSCTASPSACQAPFICTDTGSGVKKCLCENGKYYDGTNCQTKVGHDSSCTASPSACQAPFICTDTGSGVKKCLCENGKYYDGTNCQTKVGHDSSCTASPSACQTAFVCIDTGSGVKKCLCENGKYYDGTNCQTKVGYNSSCTASPSACQVAFVCMDTGSGVKKCLCDNGKYYNGTNCQTIDQLIPVLTLSNPTTNSISTSWFGPATSHYTTLYFLTWKTTSSDVPTGSYNDTANTKYIIPSLTPGTQYTVSVIRQITEKVVNRVQTIQGQDQSGTTRIGYNQSCSSNLCFDQHTTCYHQRCRCDAGYYWSTICKSIEDFKPQAVVTYVTGTTTVYANWTSTNNPVVTGYNVTISPWETGIVKVITNKTVTISGLTPGELYLVTVKSEITYVEGRNEETSPTIATPKRTTPAKTTGIDDSGNTTLNEPTIQIWFHKAVGLADNYTVRLHRMEPDPYDHTEYPSNTGDVISADFSSVTAGQMYTLTIITNKDVFRSEPFTTTIRVKAKQAGIVRDLTVSPFTSRSIYVTWMRPEKPNGYIYQYIMKTSTNSHCVQGVVFNCTECSRGEMEIDSVTSSVPCNKTMNEVISKNDIDNETYQVSHNVTDLLPDSVYAIRVAAYNQEGEGAAKTLTRKTNAEAAGPPTDFSSTSQSASSILLTWKPPVPRPGATGYNIVVKERREDNDSYREVRDFNVTEGYETKMYNVTGLSSYWDYKFTIMAFTWVGGSQFIPLPPVKTKESKPIPVVNLNYTRPDNVYDQVQISWECPKQKDGRNGEIQTGTVRFTTDTTSADVTPEEGTVRFPAQNCKWEVVINVTAEFNYTFVVYVSNNEFHGEELIFEIDMPAGPAALMPASVGSTPTTTFENVIPLTLCPSCILARRNGKILTSGILVCKAPCAQRRKRDIKTALDYDVLPNWQRAKAVDFNQEYRTTPDNWIADSAKKDSIVYNIGNDTSCEQKAGSTFCNGPLPPGTKFVISVFACTSAGCDRSEQIIISTKEPPTNLTIIIGAVCGVIAAIIVIVLIILVVRYLRKKRYRYTEHTEIIPDGEELIDKKRPIVINNFEKRVEEMHKDSNLLFSEEFEDINALSPKHLCAASETGGNKLKNRYVNILPFDHSRVKLLPTEEDEEETDYINANYIPGYRSLREYIATQGPMTGTVNDFWRMIWEQNVPIIVMLSDLMEKGKPKVDRYYPENMEPVQYGDIVVEMTNYSPLSKYVIRIFKLQLADEVRMVRHYFLPGWQDFGANLTSDDVINFLKSVRMEIKPNNQGPILVHCSAGVGRTGTYISLDVFQQHIDEENFEKELDIFDFALKMRQNRSYMIQTEKQYIFVHDTIKEMIIRKKKEMSERDHIYQNSGQDDNVYENQAFEADVDTQDIYMNVDSATGKPTTAL